MALLSGCTLAVRPETVSPAGTFTNSPEDHRRIEVSISESPHGFTGHGNLNGTLFSISFLASYRGLGLAIFEGNVLPLNVELSFDGRTLTLLALDEPLRLGREGLPEPLPAGPFTGRFRSGGPLDTSGEIELVQNRNLIFGTGIFHDQVFALSAIVNEPESFRGRAVFTDGSDALISGTLSGRGVAVTLSGVAGPVEFKRSSGLPD